LRDEESDMPWQANFYKDAEGGTPVSIQGLPLQSMMLVPDDGEEVEVVDKKGHEGKVAVKGVAYSGYTGSKVVRIDVSTNGGVNWQRATLQESDLATHPDDSKRHFGWLRWECAATVPQGKVEIMCRATSADGVKQPILGGQHNGYLYNGCHTVNINARASE
jgi:hypothetical protein